MAKYLIHACKSRIWYVNEYLIPSMIKQGIAKENIDIFLDDGNKGCLQACIESFNSVVNNPGGTWHLQDDVLISSRFKEITELEDSGVKCGFASKYDAGKPGYVRLIDMWYSFPCIRIPNVLAGEFCTWLYQNKDRYKEMVGTNKHDDTLFNTFLKNKYDSIKVTNIAPNLVEHVDYLIGGSIINKQRQEIITSLYWNEPNLVEELKRKIVYIH